VVQKEIKALILNKMVKFWIKWLKLITLERLYYIFLIFLHLYI
jgi:hypothetical protein